MNNANRCALALLTAFTLAGCTCVDVDYDRNQSADLADLDLDGVINERDRCAGTPPMSVLTNDGCSSTEFEHKEATLLVEFDMDDAKLSDDEREMINKIAIYMQRNTESTVILIGDTSPEASLAYNQKLATKRTQVVAAQLERLGIKPHRIKQMIFTDPLAQDYLASLPPRLRRTVAIVGWDSEQAQQRWYIYSSEQQVEQRNASAE